VPPLALVATGGAVLFFVVTQVRREPPVEAGTVAAVGAASLASERSSDDEFTPIFDIVRIEPTGEGLRQTRPWNCCTTVTCMIERLQIDLDSSS
jgi:hypothetical protein